MAYALMHEQKPRDCARAMGVQLRSGGHRSAHKSHRQLRDDILQVVETHISNPIGMADADSPRLTEPRLLPKDPPKGTTKNLSATGSNSVIEILLSYGILAKHNNCALTKEEMIVGILRHEASLEYGGNLDHDAWRSSRGAELIMLPLEGKQLSLRAMVADYHLRLTHVGGLSK